MSGGAALAILCAGVYGYMAGFGLSRHDQRIQTVPLTTDAGIESFPDLSPAGSQVAFIKIDEVRGAQLMVQSIADGSTRSLGRATGGGFPRWSPDGRWIAFMRGSADVAELVLISPDGKNSKTVTRLSGNNRLHNARNALSLSWTHDASAIAIAESPDQGDTMSLFLVSRDTGHRRRLTTPPAGTYGDTQCAFSPDGRWLAFVRYQTGTEADVYLVATTGGGEPKRLTYDDSHVEGLAWLPDSSGLVFGSNRTARIRMALWRLDLTSPAELQHLAGTDSDASFPSSVRLMGDGRLRLVCQSWVRDVNLWRADTAHGVTGASPVARSPMKDYNPQFSPDGKRLAFISTRSGSQELWVSNSDGTEAQQVTALQRGFSDSPRWSPDGNSIAFTSNKGSNRDIYLTSLKGGPPRCIVEAPSDEGRPSFSRDGQWLYFRSDRTGKPQIWKIPVKGGQPIQLTFGGGWEGFESSDGKCFYYIRSLEWGGIWEVAANGGQERQILDAGWQSRWALADDAIYYQAYPRDELLRFDLKSRRVIGLGLLKAGRPNFGGGMSVLRDGSAVVWTQIDVDKLDLVVLGLPGSKRSRWF